MTIKYCGQCASELSMGFPPGEQMPRQLCRDCGWVFYDNPKVIVACAVIDDDRVLWIRRGIEPQKGKWALPSGFMEKNETLEQAACRELLEETGIQCEADELNLYSVGTLGVVDQVHINFWVRYRGQPYYLNSEEALDIAFFSEGQLPGEEIAYPILNFSSRGFYREMRAGKFGIYMGEVKSSGDVRVHRVGCSNREPIRDIGADILQTRQQERIR